MKRTPLKRKTPQKASRKPKIARRAKKTPKQPSIRILKKKLWNEVKRLTRERWPNICYTCGARNLEGQNDQAGHGKPMGALPLRFKYDLRNIKRQCLVCNIHRGGMTDIFIAKLEQEDEGLDFLEDACYFDVDTQAWRIRQDTPLLGGRDATIFIENLLKLYRDLTYL